MLMTPMIQSFVHHFGEMGSKWGFNRTIGQMYALLVIADKPLTANQLSEALGISRGNVSMGIKELQSWELISLSHIQGDRKDYFSAKGTIWDMANKVMAQRKKREVDPTLSMLRDVLIDQPANDSEAHAQDKMREIYELLENISQWSEELQKLQPEQLQTLLKLGSGIGKVIDIKDKLVGKKN